ncbi:MAG: hypothetical protein R2708_08960 [Vicinamibacterales bacterium]
MSKGDAVPSRERAIDHIFWRSTGPAADTMAMLTGKGVELETPVGRDGKPARPHRPEPAERPAHRVLRRE